MAFATINKPNTHFNTVLWTGNGGTQTITGVGFQPSLVWGKSRSVNYEQSWIDFVRGGTKYLFSNGSSAESTDANAITSFNADGFSIGSSPYIGNANGATYVGWNWLASNSTVSNTSGTISSTVSANQTAGFSIVSYTGNGTSGASIGHGLGVAPAFTIVKNRSTGGRNWQGFHKSLGNTKSHLLNSTEVPRTNAVFWNNTSPTSTLITLGNDADVNESGQSFIAYCFAEVKGYSKFGSYTGNGSNDGTFVYTGFKPAYLMIKNVDLGAGYGFWCIWDNKRNTNNPENIYLTANANDVDNSGDTGGVDFLSNGFKFRNSYDYSNRSACNYIYAAFAEQPLVGTNNIPCTAR
jgi:hypothetical protein